jgi:hypothetical protein
MEEEMCNVWRKTLVTVGIAATLMVGPGIGMANAAPLQLQPTQIEELLDPIPEMLEALFPEQEEPEYP